MVLSQRDAVQAVTSRLSVIRAERERLQKIDDYLRGEHDAPYQPRTPNGEYRKLVKRAVSNWLPLIVDAPAQQLYVEGYRRSDAEDNAPVWDYGWQANGLDSRQTPIHRAAFGYGTSYVTVLTGDTGPAIRGVSSRKMLAFYADPAEDDWPVYAIRLEKSGGAWLARLYDDEAVYFVGLDSVDLDEATYIEHRTHDLGVCPVVRFTDGLDLDGRARGQIEPLIPNQDRINQTVFDLLLAQTYGATKIRTVSGMELPGDDVDEDATAEEVAAAQAIRRAKQIELSVDRFLVADDADTKFGSLDETPLGGFIESLDTSVRHLAAISQTPPSYLLGQMANLSAEALASAEAGLTRKVEERKHILGESWEQVLRLAAVAYGDRETAADFSAQVVWRDTEARSLASTVDALGKAATMLGIPPEFLWERIPGVTQTDVKKWKKGREEALASDPLAAFGATLDAQTVPSTIDPADVKARADAMGALIRAGATFDSAAAQVGLAGLATDGAVPTSLRLPAADASGLEQA